MKFFLFSEEHSAKNYDFRAFLIVLTFLSLFMVCWCGPFSVYSGHDYYFHLIRFEELIEALKEGSFPFYLDYEVIEGYGYFTKAFYPDLMLIPFAPVAMVLGSEMALYVMIFTFTFLCGLSMYYAVNTIFKNTFVASVSSIVYTFSAYHIFDWYNRAAFAEGISFTFLPLVFLGLYHIIVGDYKKWYILAIGYSLLIYTHLLSSVMTFMFIVALLLIGYRSLIKEPKRILYLFLAATVTLFLVGSYLFPMIEQMLSNTFYYSTNVNITGYRKQRLSEMFWGALNGFMYKKTWIHANACGTGPILLILASLRLFVWEKTRLRKMADLCLVIGIFLLFMISIYFPWGRLPLGFIQFPWRFYEFVSFFFAIAGAYYLSVLIKSSKYRVIVGCVLIALTVFSIIGSNKNYIFVQEWTKEFSPKERFQRASVRNIDYHLGMYEYIPVKVPSLQFIYERGDSIRVLNSSTEILNFSSVNGYTSFDVSIDLRDEIELPLLYYKGYKATLDGVNVPISESENGLLQVEIDKGGHVEVYYNGTFIQTISWIISLLSVLALCIYLFRERKKTK